MFTARPGLLPTQGNRRSAQYSQSVVEFGVSAELVDLGIVKLLSIRLADKFINVQPCWMPVPKWHVHFTMGSALGMRRPKLANQVHRNTS